MKDINAKEIVSELDHQPKETVEDSKITEKGQGDAALNASPIINEN